jgi:hypothetical protein
MSPKSQPPPVKRYLGGLIAGLLLVPVPAYATLILGNTLPWTSILIYNNSTQSKNSPWRVSADGSSGVSIQPVSGSASTDPGDTYIDVYASINSGSQINSAATTNFNSMTVKGEVTVSVQVFKTLSISGPFTNLTPQYTYTLNSPNQFSSLSGSNALFGNPGTASINNYNYIHVRFDFTPGSSWTATPSSPMTVVFTGM